jgi:hypothetical protein
MSQTLKKQCRKKKEINKTRAFLSCFRIAPDFRTYFKAVVIKQQRLGIPVIPVLVRLRQEDHKFQDSLEI